MQICGLFTFNFFMSSNLLARILLFEKQLSDLNPMQKTSLVMKNKITLLIASVLLVLCVMQKESRYGATKGESVEKMYNFSPIGQNNDKTQEPQFGDQLLTDSQTFEFASADTVSKKEISARLVNQRLLNISSGGKILNY